MRAVIYARISEDRDETQLGVGRQVADCEALAARRQWQVVERYIDNDVSAYSARARPEYERMLADIRAGVVDAVLVYHQDRLHRQPRELEAFFDVCDQAGVTQMATVSGEIDLGTDDGRFHARIMGAVARKSSDDQSRRLKRKALELAQSGMPTGGGSRPFGFESDRVTVRESEAVVIRELAARLLAGESLRGLCMDLDNRGIRTSTGGQWISSPLRRMLCSARISGQREHRGEIIGPATWDAIIPVEQTTRIRALMADPGRRAVRAPQKYLLKGVLRCGVCDTPLVARPREDGVRRYVCATGPGFAGCGGVFVLGPPVEEFVTYAMFERLDSPGLRAAVAGSRTVPADIDVARADRLVDRLDELAAAYAAERVSMREWLTARDPLQRELDDARRRIARTSTVGLVGEYVGQGHALLDRWPEMALDRQHALVRSVVSHVIVSRGRRGLNRFDPSRFQIIWRY